MVHVSLLYIFTFSLVFISARLISLFVLVLFDFGNVVFEYFAHLFSGIYHSCYPTPWDSFSCRVTYDAHCCAWRARQPQSMGFYLLDIFIRRLLVRMRAKLFGAFLINYNFFFARKLCSLGSFRTLCVHSRWSVLFASHLCVCLFSFYFHCFGTFIHFGTISALH